MSSCWLRGLSEGGGKLERYATLKTDGEWIRLSRNLLGGNGVELANLRSGRAASNKDKTMLGEWHGSVGGGRERLSGFRSKKTYLNTALTIKCFASDAQNAALDS